MTDKSPEYFKRILTDIYPCRHPFSLAIIHTKPKTRMGTYNPAKAHIRINDGWGGDEQCIETAIHELAHHIHYTEKEKKARSEKPHGKQFWQIYGQLMMIAKQKGYYTHFDVILS